MECIEAIEARKSVRKFIDKAVSREDILKILDAARLAPSAKNRQPWRFCILNDEQKRELSMDLLNKFKQDKSEESGVASAKIIGGCGMVVLVFMDSREMEKIGYSLIPDYLSVGAAIENALLRATELGIASLWVYDTVALKSELESKFGDGLKFVCALCFGYQDGIIAPCKKKKSLNEIII